MKFAATLPGASTTADPIAAPGDVPIANVLTVPPSLPNSDHPVKRLLLGAQGGDVPVEVYVEVERPPASSLPELPAMAERVWLLASTITVEDGEVIAAELVGAGNIYVRIATGVADTTVVVGFLP